MDNRKNSTEWRPSFITRPAPDQSAAKTRRRTLSVETLQRRSLLMATIATALALLPLSFYRLVGAQEVGSVNSGSVQTTSDERTVQFTLVPAATAIANCFPNATAKVKVSLTGDTDGTDTFTLSAKGLRPNTSFAVFLTELPAAPFGAVQYLADLTTNAGGKGSVEVNALIEEAFSSQVIDGQRIRKELNHVVFWFADPADADDCFLPGTAPITPFDGDGTAGPAAMSSKNALPGAPLP